MRVFARIEESLRRIFVQENASLGWTPDRLSSLNEPTIIGDLIFARIVIPFFVVGALYVRFCEHL